MLKTRIITALVLMAILLPIMFYGNPQIFSLASVVFLVAGMWEAQRLFNKPGPLVIALVWSLIFLYLTLQSTPFSMPTLFLMCVLFWVFGLIPSLKLGLPSIGQFSSGLLSGVYSVSILGCFVAMSYLFAKSPLFLFSILAIVWIADIGAYVCGKAFGKHKIAPRISPGKSWEGAIGGGVLVVLAALMCAFMLPTTDTFAYQLVARKGVITMLIVMLVLVVLSVVGDLFESSLKRRIDVKDSSQLLPGHGGVLDRIDALIPVLPAAALISAQWL